MLKLLIPITILFAAFLLACWIVSYLTLRLDFSKIFSATVLPAPTPDTDGLSIHINGTDGDFAVVGFAAPGAELTFPERISEEIVIEGKNLDEIRTALNAIEVEKFEFLTLLPSSVFRFDIYLRNDTSSPNNAKKISHYVISQGGTSRKLLPGAHIALARNAKFDDLSKTLTSMQIALVYQHGLYQSFYDSTGKLVSQATGTLVIKPTMFVQFLVFLASWTFVIALFTLFKETILSGREATSLLEYLKAP